MDRVDRIRRKLVTLGSHGIGKWVYIVGVFWLLSFAGQESGAQEGISRMEKEAKQSIGSARMEEDGTIVLQLRAEGAKGLIGDALLRYPPGHPEYNDILRHLGGLKKGEVKQVPPWPGRNDQKN